MLFSSFKKQAKPVLPVSISKPIRYYTNDSLHFNTSKDKLYGEIYSKECMFKYKDALTSETSSSSLREHGSGSNDITTMLLYILIALLSLTSLILYATIIPLWESNFEHTRSPIRGDWTDGLLLLPLSISFISAAIIVLRWVVKRRSQQRRQNHHRHNHRDDSSKTKHDSTPVPFYTMLLSSTLILLLTPLLILASTNSLSRAFRSSPAQSPPPPPTSPSTSSSSSSSSSAGTNPTPNVQRCTMTNIMTKPCVPILYHIGELQIGGAVTAGLVCSLWITVFVLAVRQYFQIKSYERQRRRRHRERRQARRDARRHARRQEQEKQETDQAGKAGKVGESMDVKKNMDQKQTRFPVKAHHSSSRRHRPLDEYALSLRGTEHTYRSSEQIIGLSRPPRAC